MASKRNEKDKNMKKNLKTSVVITLLDDFRVKRTLDSLISQNKLPDEIVVADGGSKKELLEMLHEYEKKDRRVKVYILLGSVAETRNKVLPLLNGDLVIFLDALEQALWSRKPVDGLIHHSDCGSQYLFIRYSERLAGAGTKVGKITGYNQSK